MAERILLADDSITIQKVVGLTFASESYELEVVDNGADAFSAISQNKPDLVLADTDMPELNGFELCRKIKESDPDLPVILLYNTYEVFDSDQAEEVGADFWSPKPFDADTLMNKIRDLLSAATEEAPEEAAEELEQLEEAEEITPFDDLGDGDIVTGFDEVDEATTIGIEPEAVADLVETEAEGLSEEDVEKESTSVESLPGEEVAEADEDSPEASAPLDAIVLDAPEPAQEPETTASVASGTTSDSGNDDPWSLDGVDPYGTEVGSTLEAVVDTGERDEEEENLEDVAQLEDVEEPTEFAAVDEGEEHAEDMENASPVQEEDTVVEPAEEFEASVMDFADMDTDEPSLMEEAADLQTETTPETLEEDSTVVEEQPEERDEEPQDEALEIAPANEVVTEDTEIDDEMAAFEAMAASGALDGEEEVVEEEKSATVSADEQPESGDAMMDEFEAFVHSTGEAPSETPEEQDDILNDLATFEGADEAIEQETVEESAIEDSPPEEETQPEDDVVDEDAAETEEEPVGEEEFTSEDLSEEDSPFVEEAPAEVDDELAEEGSDTEPVATVLPAPMDADALADQVERTVRQVVDQVVAEKLEVVIRESLSAAVEKVTREILEKLRS